jgi:hypothetical protein
MKIKNNIFESEFRIQLPKLQNMDLTVGQSYAVVKVCDALDKHKKIYDEAKQNLFTKHGDKEGEAITVSEEKKPAFLKDLQELLDIEIEVDFKPIELPKDAKVSPVFISALKPFLKLE